MDKNRLFAKASAVALIALCVSLFAMILTGCAPDDKKGSDEPSFTPNTFGYMDDNGYVRLAAFAGNTADEVSALLDSSNMNYFTAEGMKYAETEEGMATVGFMCSEDDAEHTGGCPDIPVEGAYVVGGSDYVAGYYITLPYEKIDDVVSVWGFDKVKFLAKGVNPDNGDVVQLAAIADDGKGHDVLVGLMVDGNGNVICLVTNEEGLKFGLGGVVLLSGFENGFDGFADALIENTAYSGVKWDVEVDELGGSAK